MAPPYGVQLVADNEGVLLVDRDARKSDKKEVFVYFTVLHTGYIDEHLQFE